MTDELIELRWVRRDGVPQRQLKCPTCGTWGDIDDDQFHGRVSIDHSEEACEFHETIDLSTDLRVRVIDDQDSV